MNYEHFMEEALGLARKALSFGEFPVGCILVYENTILAESSRTGTLGDSVNEIDHAEMIALKQLAGSKEDLDKNRITAFCTLEPCLMCFGALLVSGIGEIVYAYEDVMGGGTKCDLTNLTPLYKNCQTAIVPNILRAKSLKLFKAYFENSKNAYLKGSLLAGYTLSL